MKKRLIAIALTVVLCVGLFAVLVSCGKEESTGLVFGKKYIYEEAINSNKAARRFDSFIFYDDGTGIFHCKNINYDYDKVAYSYNYKIKFRYVFVDDDKSGVVCFYDELLTNDSSIYYYSYDDEKNEILEDSIEKIEFSEYDWSVLLSVSENVLVLTTTYIGIFVNEDYADKLTNFNKIPENQTEK